MWQRSQPLRYILVGAANTGLSYAAYCLALALGLSVPMASLVAIIAGVMTGFLSQGYVVFGNVTFGAMLRFVANWMAMYAVYVSVVTALHRAGVTPYVGGLIAVVPTSLVSYIVLRRFVFVGRV